MTTLFALAFAMVMSTVALHFAILCEDYRTRMNQWRFKYEDLLRGVEALNRKLNK